MKSLMKSIFKLSAIGLFVILSSCSSNEEAKVTEVSTEDKENKRYDLSLKDKLNVFKALPSESIKSDNPSSEAQVKLGHILYFDERLSENNTISCNSCHNLATSGVDNLSFSPGTEGNLGSRNSPTTLNAALHKSQFWDGRAKDVEDQAGMPILNPVEMNISNEKYLVDKLSKIELYKDLFSKAYPNDDSPITYQNLKNAIGNYERKLLTPSRFDDYLNGEMSAITLQEKQGLSSFISTGCIQCHIGAALGGNMIQKFGKYSDYWTLTGSKNIDKGLAEQTKNEEDNYKFKVPSLRNIAGTGPYFHDGSVSDLGEAITIMAKAQLDYKISKREVDNITAFLNTLTGKIPEEYSSRPSELK